MEKVCQNVLEAMGSTPIIQLQKIVPPESARVLVKFEGLNVGGSIKTRTAYNMICDAEKKGLINRPHRSWMECLRGLRTHRSRRTCRRSS